jgi:hypothetical protein
VRRMARLTSRAGEEHARPFRIRYGSDNGKIWRLSRIWRLDQRLVS